MKKWISDPHGLVGGWKQDKDKGIGYVIHSLIQ